VCFFNVGSGRVDPDHFSISEFRAFFVQHQPDKIKCCCASVGGKQCQIKFYVPNVMAREQFPVLHVMVLAKLQSSVSHLLSVKNAVDQVVTFAIYAVVLAKSNQQIQG